MCWYDFCMGGGCRYIGGNGGQGGGGGSGSDYGTTLNNDGKGFIKASNNWHGEGENQGQTPVPEKSIGNTNNRLSN